MGLLDTLLGSRNAGGGYSGGLLSIPGQLAGGLLGSVITPVQRGLWGTSSQDIAAQRKQLLDQAQQDHELQRQLLQMQLEAAQTAQAQRGQDQQTAMKFGDLLNTQGVRQFNAANPGELQMVENTAQRSGPQYASLDQLMATPSFARLAEQNPRVKALTTPQKLGPGDIIGSPMGGTLMSNPKPQDLPNGMMFGPDNKPTWVPGYVEGQARIAAASRAPEQPKLETIIGPDGQPKLVAARDAIGQTPYTKPAVSPKDINTAKQKLINLSAAEKALALVEQKAAALKDSMQAGPGASYYTFGEGGANFDAAVNSMRDLIQSVTRVPGIGSMSDFETRLSQAKMPSRNGYESTMTQQIQSLKDLLSGLRQGYEGLLSDNSPDQTANPAPSLGIGQGANIGGAVVRRIK